MAGQTVNPKISITLLPAAVIEALENRRDLLIGQLGTGATATSGVLNQDLQSLSNDAVKSLLGTGELYYRFLAWRAGNSNYSPCDVIALTSGGGVSATSTIVVSVAPTESGTFYINIIDKKQFRVSVSVVSTDTVNTVGDKMVAAINAVTDKIFTANNSGSDDTVNIEADDDGLAGNSYGIEIENSIAGLDFTTTSMAFSGGTLTPTLTGVLDVIDGIRYTGVSFPEGWAFDLSTYITTSDFEDEIKAVFDARFNEVPGVHDGVVFVGATGTLANLKKLVNTAGSNYQNSQSVVFMGNNKINTTYYKAPAELIPADWVVSFFMGICSKRLTDEANIANDIVATNGTLDFFGGAALASLPYFNTVLSNVPITLPTNLFNSEEQAELQEAGFTTYGVYNNVMRMNTVVTTWKKDSLGQDNDSFKYLNYVHTGSVCREVFYNVLLSTYAQSRLTIGDLVAGRNIANEGSIRGTLQQTYRFLANQVLTILGREAESFFNQNLNISISLVDRKVTINGQLPIVTQIENIDYIVQLAFDFNVGLTIG